MKIEWNKKYTTIALYVCVVLAIAIIGISFFVYLPRIFSAIGSFFKLISPVFWGLVLAYLINPVLKFVETKNLFFLKKTKDSSSFKHLIALIVTYLIVVLIVFLFGLLIFPELIKNFDSITQNLSTNINNIYDYIRNFLETNFKIQLGELSDSIPLIINSTVDSMSNVGSSIGRFVFNFIIGLLLSFFTLLSKDSLISGFKKLLAAISKPKVYNYISKTLKMADDVFGKFFIGKVFDSLIIGLIMLIVLSIFKLPFFPKVFNMPYFLLISAVVCLTNIIPYIGPILGTIPSVLLVFIDNEGGLIRAIILLSIIIVVQILDANVIGPKVLGKSIGISSLWVVVSIIVIGSLMGVFGMFIAVPLFTVIYNLISDFTNNRLRKKQLSTSTNDYSIQTENEVPDLFVRVETNNPIDSESDLPNDASEEDHNEEV